jgi:hypothetical protein
MGKYFRAADGGVTETRGRQATSAERLVCGHCGYGMTGVTRVGRRMDRCDGHVRFGKAFCTSNRIYEQPLLDVVLRKLQQEFLSPERLTALRDEVRRQEEAERSPQNVGRLKATVERLGKQIDKGTERLAVVPADMVPGLSAKIREWLSDQDRLAGELRQAESAGEAPAALDGDIKAVEAALWSLRDAVTQDDHVLLRELMRNLISKVEVWWTTRPTPTGKLYTKVERGVIHVRRQADGGDYLFAAADRATGPARRR